MGAGWAERGTWRDLSGWNADGKRGRDAFPAGEEQAGIPIAPHRGCEAGLQPLETSKAWRLETATTASADLHFVADAGEQADFLHVVRAQDDAVRGGVGGLAAAADLEGWLRDLDDFLRSAVVLRLGRDLLAAELSQFRADLGFARRQLAGDAEVDDGIFADETAAVPD